MNDVAGNTTNISQAYRIRTISIIIGILIATVIMDLYLLRVYDTTSKQVVHLETKEFVFAAISVACLTSEYLLLRVLRPRPKSEERRTEMITRLSYHITTIVLIVLGTIIIYIISQVLLLSYYDVFAILAVILCSYAVCMAILGTFIHRIISWLSLRKNMLVIILFVVALASIVFNAATVLLDTSLRLADRPAQTRPLYGASVDVSKGKFDNIDYLYFSSYVLSYLTAWIATASLLHRYSRRIGYFRFSILMASPLAFFLMQFSASFASIVSPITGLNQFYLTGLVTLIISFSKPIGGLMLGIGFWTMAKFAGKDTSLRFYLIITGFGMLLLFTSNQAILLSIAPYPPFGISTMSVMGLSSYLIILGVYASSLSISNDERLRREIRLAASSEAKLLEGLVTGEKRKEIEGRVLRIIRKQALEMEDETGASPSMTDEEIRKYLDNVLKEIKRV